MAASYRYGMPFRLAVTPELISEELSVSGKAFRRRVFDPGTTIWAWMAQIAAQDRSCRHAVSRVVAFHAANGRTVSAATGAYAQARQRLETGVIRSLARRIGRGLECEWAGRPVLAVDGSMLSGPDTESNQAEFPQHGEMKPGVGFPMIRVVYLVSLTTGAVIDFGLAPHKGAGTGELSQFRRMFRRLRQGDLVVADRAYESFWHRQLLRDRGVDTLLRLRDRFAPHTHPRLKTLGRGDWIVSQERPANRPKWLTPKDVFPKHTRVRLTSARLGEGNQLHLASTIEDPSVTRKILMETFRSRWDIEVDIRSLKIDLGMEILRCKSAEMLEKEAWATVLTYNAIRYLICMAADRHEVHPRSLSFKGAMQAIEAFGPRMDLASEREADALLVRMLEAIASHSVRNRPGRAEPRVCKRRRKPIRLMTVPRDEARANLKNGRYR